MLKSISFDVVGDQKIVCDGCEQRIEKALKTMQGVEKVRANARDQRVEVLFDAAKVDSAALTDRIQAVGYQTKIAYPSAG